MQRHGWPFLACLPAAFVVAALIGAVLERLIYRPMCLQPAAPGPGAVLARPRVHGGGGGVDYVMGSQQQNIQLPDYFRHRFEFGSGPWMLGMGAYRLFIVVVCVALALGLQALLTGTRFGSRLRAAVDDPRVAAGMGIPVNRVFLVTFAVGSGLAGLGGALGADILGLDPQFPLKYMVYFLIVCAVGGTSSITGPLVAAVVLGIADVMGKYYVPKLGGFIVYALMIAILLWRPQGLFSREGRR